MEPLKGTTYVAAETTPKPPGERVHQKCGILALGGCGFSMFRMLGSPLGDWMVEVGWVVSDHRGSYRTQTTRWDHRGVSDVVQATWWVLTYSSMWCELRGVSYVAGANVLVNVV